MGFLPRCAASIVRESSMALRTVRSFVTRARHAIAFIAIVWGVAATFVAFEVVSLSAVDFALSYPALFGDLMLSRTVTESTSCTAAAGSERPQPSTTISEADARVGPWLLGLSLGRDAVFRQYAPSNRQVPEQLAKGRDDLAARLSVPSPEPFTPEQIANANTEFVAFVEQGGAAGQRGSSPPRIHLERASCSSSGRCGATRKWSGPCFPGNARCSEWRSVITRGGRTSRSHCGVRCCKSPQPTPNAKTSSRRQRR